METGPYTERDRSTNRLSCWDISPPARAPSSSPSLCSSCGELLAKRGRDPDRFPMETMIDYSLGRDIWRQQAVAWEESGGSILSIRTMSTGADYHGVARVELPDPSAHIAALGEFALVARG